mmetsp:Transcript_26627/g.53053  ORF Transcript_26627/g.53053 Transcript_26627/m.53053 type:complete len:206 (-) Transcript_26627:14-631(-)
MMSSWCMPFFSSLAKRLNRSRSLSPSLAVVPVGKTTLNFPAVPNVDLIWPTSPDSVSTFIPTKSDMSVSFLKRSDPNISYLTTFFVAIPCVRVSKALNFSFLLFLCIYLQSFDIPWCLELLRQPSRECQAAGACVRVRIEPGCDHKTVQGTVYRVLERQEGPLEGLLLHVPVLLRGANAAVAVVCGADHSVLELEISGEVEPGAR